jgi:hypothetical protein
MSDGARSQRTVAIARARDGSVGLRFVRPVGRAAGPCEVTSLTPGGAAQRSGLIRPGDFISAVDGTDVAALDDDAVSALFRGKPGSALELSLCCLLPASARTAQRGTREHTASHGGDRPGRGERRANALGSDSDVASAVAWMTSSGQLPSRHVADFEALAKLLRSVSLPPETVGQPIHTSSRRPHSQQYSLHNARSSLTLRLCRSYFQVLSSGKVPTAASREGNCVATRWRSSWRTPTLRHHSARCESSPMVIDLDWP